MFKRFFRLYGISHLSSSIFFYNWWNVHTHTHLNVTFIVLFYIFYTIRLFLLKRITFRIDRTVLYCTFYICNAFLSVQQENHIKIVSLKVHSVHSMWLSSVSSLCQFHFENKWIFHRLQSPSLPKFSNCQNTIYRILG